jgi:ABC-type transport system involved in multi-copper enzyme maturation permease subunit
MRILKNLLAIVGLISIIAILFVLIFGQVIVKNNDNEIYNSKPLTVSAPTPMTSYKIQVEQLKVLEEIRDNGDDILSKLDTVCDKLDNLR